MEARAERAPQTVDEKPCSLRGVSVRFGDVEALRDVDFELNAGSVTAIVGPNGAGKTTLLRLLAATLAPDVGEVEILGVAAPSRAVGQARHDLRQRVAYISQRPHLDPEMHGREILHLFATLYGFGGGARRRRVEEKIADYGLETFVDRRIAGYSGGQKRRLHLAASLLHDPQLILLDEPMAGLDARGKKSLLQDLARRAEAGAAIAIITHDASAVAENADVIVRLENGEIRGREQSSPPRHLSVPSAHAMPPRPRVFEAAWQICRRAWVKTLRRPVTLTFSLAQPLIWMAFFGFLFERYQLTGAQGIRYLDYLVPGICAMTVLFGASQSGISWIRDLNTGFLPRLLGTPTSPHTLLLGKIAADVLRLLVQATAVLLLALLLGARLAPTAGAVGLGFVALLLFAIAFSSLSCAIALKTRAQEAMATFVHLVNMPMLFTSTALVPARQMPGWLEGLATYNPLSLAVDAWRGALLDGVAPTFGLLWPLFLLATVLFLLAARQMTSIAKLH